LTSRRLSSVAPEAGREQVKDLLRDPFALPGLLLRRGRGDTDRGCNRRRHNLRLGIVETSPYIVCNRFGKQIFPSIPALS
jgi:hypothetical protein